jgi:hypothetical protein
MMTRQNPGVPGRPPPAKARVMPIRCLPAAASDSGAPAPTASPSVGSGGSAPDAVAGGGEPPR